MSTAACLLGFVGSNPVGSMDVFFVSVVCRQEEVSATGRSLVQRSPTYRGVSLCVISKPKKLGDPGPRWAVAPERKRQIETERFCNE